MANRHLQYELPLTERRQEILALVANGYSDRYIAFQLGIKQSTVRKQLDNIYQVLDVEARWDIDRRVVIALYALQYGIVRKPLDKLDVVKGS